MDTSTPSFTARRRRFARLLCLSAAAACLSCLSRNENRQQTVPLTIPTAGSTWFAQAANFFDPAQDRKGGEAVAVLDFEQDGLLDLAIANGTGTILLAHHSLEAGSGNSFRLERLEVGKQGDGAKGGNFRIKGFGLHDFDDDGLLDLYASTGGPSTPYLKPARGGGVKKDWRDKDLIKRPDDPGRTVWISRGPAGFEHHDLGIDGEGCKRYVLFDDFDRNGTVDGYLSNASYYGVWYGGSSAPSRFFLRAEEGLHFTALPPGATGPSSQLWMDEFGRSVLNTKGGVVRDFDGDGKADLMLGCFADVWNLVKDPPRTTSAAEDAIDLDRDGVGDGGYQGAWNRGILFLRNVSEAGGIRFENASGRAFLDRDGQAQDVFGKTDQMHVHAIVPADLDQDGDLDLFVSGQRNLATHNPTGKPHDIVRVYRNDSTPGAPRFVEITEDAGLEFMNHEEQLRGRKDVHAAYPLDLEVGGVVLRFVPSLSAGAALDLDNDGDVDIVHIDRQPFTEHPTTGKPLGVTPWVWENDGHARFSLVDPDVHGIGVTGREMSYGDFDGDGRLDLVVVNGDGGGQSVEDGNYIYLNRIRTSNHWLGIAVSYPGSRIGLGTKVLVRDHRSGRILGYDEVRTDFCYRSKRNASLHFGLGSTTAVDVELLAPSGARADYRKLPVDQRLRLSVQEH